MNRIDRKGTGHAARKYAIRRRAVVAAAGAAAVALGVVAPASRAADVHWIAADGNWTTPENWSTTTVPVATDVAILDFASGVSHVTSDLADDILTLRVQNGSTLSIEPTGDLRTVIGNSAPTLVNDPLQATRIGDGSAGTLAINDGTFITTYTNASANQSADVYIGVGAGGLGTLTKSGTLSVLTTRDLRIGSDAGAGTATISGGTVNTNFVIIGRTGGTGSVALSGGTMSSIGQYNIGAGGGGDGTGTLAMTGGTITSTSVISVGRDGTSTGTNRGFGTFTLDAGQVEAKFTGTGTTNGHFVVGMNGGKGTMTMNGGTVNTASGFYVAYNDNGNVANRSEGSLDMHGGTATVGGMFHVGYEAATGLMTMDGGTITVTGMSGVAYDDRTATTRATLTVGSFTQTGGTINAKGGFTVARGSSNGTYNLGTAAVLNVGTGTTGDLLVGQTDSVTVAHTMSGNLNINDGATVTVAGAMRVGLNGGKGTLTTTGGSLSVTGSSLIGDNTAGAVGVANLGGGTQTFAGNLTVGDGAPVSGTLNVTAGTLNVTGQLVAGRQTTVSGVISQSGGIINAGSLGIRTSTASAAATKFTLSGGTLNVAGAVTNNSTLEAKLTGVANVGAIGGTGTMTVADTATVNANSVRQASLNMTGGTIKIAQTTTGTPSGVSVIPSFALSGQSRFDLTDNKLITNTAPGTATAGVYNGLQGSVQSAYDFNAWDLPGLTTSKPDAIAGLTTIGVATGAQIRGLGPTDTDTFGGQTITGASTIAMYTYAGDANLDGVIDGGDYGTIDNFVQVPGADGYANGDFNYDGVIDGGDYGVIDNNIQAQGPGFATSGAASALSGVTAVPEPSACGFAILTAATLLSRRRRRLGIPQTM